jgi:hypothetical protein
MARLSVPWHGPVACEPAADEAHREAGRGSDLETAPVDQDMPLCSWSRRASETRRQRRQPVGKAGAAIVETGGPESRGCSQRHMWARGWAC